MDTMWKVLTRKKILDPVSTEQSELGRVLNTVDLTALGVGSTLGVGVYVLAGHVAKDTAGPAVVLSFLIATIASVFAGLCYAEFGARTPRAGSAYIYSYVCVGEFIAFIIGWNLILEYVIGSASVARGLSLYLDTLINNTLKDTFIDIAPMGNVSFMSAYFDFFAFGISLLLAVALAFGLKESSWVNNIFTLVNLVVVAFVIIAGSIKADAQNWHVNASAVLNISNGTHVGEGGFFPFGVEGMVKGAATCFYGFVGFDCIATTGEEVKNPKKAIPLAIVISLFVIFLAYFGTSTVVTLMIPYYEQDPNAPLPHAFASVGWDWAKWIVAIGGIFGLCASLFGAMFPLPRIIYAMASDSIIFRFLGQVSTRFKTPVIGTLLAGLLTGLMAALFELKQLVNMMSIGTLLAYTIVAASVLLLRHEVEKGTVYEPLLRSVSDSEDSETYTDNRGLDIGETSEEIELINDEVTCSNIFKQIFSCGRRGSPSDVTERIIKIEVCVYCILCVLIGLCAMYLNEPIGKGEIWAIVLTAVVVGLAILVVMSMTSQPKSRKELSFKVPLVPLIPALSILINVYLMLMLDSNTWIRFGVWMAVGLPIYYFSVKTHSDARNQSICSRDTTPPNEKVNGFANHSFIDENEVITTETKKRQAPPPPSLKNIEATIADLDEMLEIEEANIISDRKFSVDSLSTASNVLHEENVEADVHCSDVPVTPIKEANPLLQSGDVDYPSPSPLYSDVAASPDAAIPESSSGGDDEQIDTYTEPITIEEEQLVTSSIAEEKENESLTEKAVPPPPPLPPLPPPMMSEIVVVPIPRPQVRVSALTSAKLKPVPVPETPPIDYSRQNSALPPDNNLKFGTPEYREFLDHLDSKLQQQSLTPIPLVTDLKKNPVLNDNNNGHVNNDVEEDSIDRENAKQKLAQFLERTNSLPLLGVRNTPQKRIENNVTENKKEVDLTNDKEKHRQNMENIFRSVRLRKGDNLENNAPDNQEDDNVETNDSENNNSSENNENKRKETNNDKHQHQQRMDNIFRSIKLRKVDSFKDSESQ